MKQVGTAPVEGVAGAGVVADGVVGTVEGGALVGGVEALEGGALVGGVEALEGGALVGGVEAVEGRFSIRFR